MDLMIILEGPQGVGKTSVLEILGREYYKNLTERITSKDIYATLKKAWIADFSELQSLTKNESSIVKNFLTIREDDYRKPYDVYSTNISRMCVFAGTTNEARYLKDITGNRRYLPYRIESANLKKIQFERDQIWAEAKYMYDHEKEWWVSERIKQTYDTVLKEREVEYTMDDVVLSFMESRKTNIVYRTEIIDELKEKLGSVDKYGLFVRVDFLLDGKWKGYHRNNGLKFYKRVEFKPEIVKEPTITDADDVYL
jgi:predicted P-loop ATPase